MGFTSAFKGKSQVINSCAISSIPCCVTRYCAFSNSFLSTFFCHSTCRPFLSLYAPYLSLFVFISPCWLLFSFLVSYLNSLCLSSLSKYPEDISPSLELNFSPHLWQGCSFLHKFQTALYARKQLTRTRNNEY